MRVRKSFLILALTLLLVLPGTGAWADPVLIRVVPGLNGLYEADEVPVQLNISITNNGPAIENGLLVVKRDPDHPALEAVYQRRVRIPANQHFKTAMLVPGELAAHGAVICLLADGTEIGRAVVQGTVTNGPVGISIGEKPLSGGLPVWWSSKMPAPGTAIIKNMTPEEIPTTPLPLAVADLLVLDGQETAGLSPEQVQAIRRWVALGGKLVLSGGAGAREGQPFAGLSPVVAGEQVMLGGNWGGMRTGTDPVPVARGTFVQGEKLVSQGDLPLIAYRSVGRGWVIYSAAGLEHLQPADEKFWETLLPARLFRPQDQHDFLFHPLLQRSTDLLPLQLPPLQLLAGIWGIYMLVVGPGLYLVLKRRHRPDWAWAGIPLTAVLTVLVIYCLGPFHRLDGPVGQTMAVVELLDEDTAEVWASGSYVAPRGGSLMLTDAGEGVFLPAVVGYPGGGSWKPPVVECRAENRQIRFDQVEFWSMRQATIYKVAGNFGQIRGELKLAGDEISGTLYNGTGMDLAACLVVVGDRAVEIGALPAGSKVHVDGSLTAARRFDWPAYLGEWLSQDRPADLYPKKEFAEFVISEKPAGVKMGVQLVGRAADLPGTMQLAHPGGANHYSALVRQRLPLALPESGAFWLPPGLVPAKIIDPGPEYTPAEPMIPGEQVVLEFDLQLPAHYPEINIRAVELSGLGPDSRPYQISVFDWANNRWVNLGAGRKRLAGEELKPYLSAQSRLRFSIAQTGTTSAAAPMPALAVEGVVK